MPEPLKQELHAFEEMLPSLTKDEGKFALVIGADLIGVFDTYADAFAAGYERAQLNPFLVKKIAGIESVANLSRDIDNQCLTTLSS